MKNESFKSIFVSNETTGIGVFQFEYCTDGDHMAWHYDTEDPAFSGGSCHWCDLPGSWARLRFLGTAVKLIGQTGPDMGSFFASLDDSDASVVECTSAEPAKAAILFQADHLSPGLHDLLLSLSSSSGNGEAPKRIAVAGAEILQNIDLAAEASCVLEIDDSDLCSTTASFQFSREWETLTEQEGLYLAGAHTTGSPGAKADIAFNGIQLELYGSKGKDQGEFAVSLDGRPLAHIDCRSDSSLSNILLFRTPVADSGKHLLSVQVISGEIVLDRVSVLTSNISPLSPVLHSGTIHQTIESFGASSGWTIDPICSNWTEENKNRLADLLYSQDKGIGLSCFRFDLGAGSRLSDKERIRDEWLWRATDCFISAPDADFSADNQQGQQWMMRAAQKRGVEQYVAYVHSPPFWLTKNGHTQCDPDTGSTNLISGGERPFAAYLTTILEGLEKLGLSFQFISPVNECGWVWEYPGVHEEGCRMSFEDIRQVNRALSEELKRRGRKEQLLGPESETIDHLTDFLEYFSGDKKALKELNGRVSAHSYFTDLFEKQGIASRQKTAKALKDHPELRYWQTEFCFMGTGRGETRDYGMTPALWLARTVHYDLVLLNACAWHWWLSVSPGDFHWKDGLVYTNWRKKGDEETAIPSKMLWGLGNFSKFIRPGAVRIGLDGIEASNEFLASAYQNTDGSIVTVWINCSCQERLVKTDRLVTDKNNCSVYLTDDGEGHDLSLENQLMENGLLHIPGRSIVTVMEQ